MVKFSIARAITCAFVIGALPAFSRPLLILASILSSVFFVTTCILTATVSLAILIPLVSFKNSTCKLFVAQVLRYIYFVLLCNHTNNTGVNDMYELQQSSYIALRALGFDICTAFRLADGEFLPCSK